MHASLVYRYAPSMASDVYNTSAGSDHEDKTPWSTQIYEHINMIENPEVEAQLQVHNPKSQFLKNLRNANILLSQSYLVIVYKERKQVGGIVFSYDQHRSRATHKQLNIIFVFKLVQEKHYMQQLLSVFVSFVKVELPLIKQICVELQECLTKYAQVYEQAGFLGPSNQLCRCQKDREALTQLTYYIE